MRFKGIVIRTLCEIGSQVTSTAGLKLNDDKCSGVLQHLTVVFSVLSRREGQNYGTGTRLQRSAFL
jgi:hypothetical protein